MPAVQQQPCRAQDRTKLLTGTGHFSVCLRWPLWHEEIFKRLSTHRRAINSFCTLAHSSPHSQTLLQLYSSHCHLCHLGQVQAQVTGLTCFWPHHLQHLQCRWQNHFWQALSLSLVLYYRCFWSIPVTCIIFLIQGRRQNCTHSAEKDDSQFWWSKILPRKATCRE